MTALLKLLLIEDDATMQTLQRALGRRGMNVTPCTDSKLALAQWTAVHPTRWCWT